MDIEYPSEDHKMVKSNSTLDYELKIDAQVEKFLELKHKVAFFIITAAIGSIGYTLTFALDHAEEISFGFGLLLLILGSISGLLVVAFALLALHLEIISYQLHLGYRYKRVSWTQLSSGQQKDWDKINSRAKFIQKLSFIVLLLSIGLQAGFFIRFLTNKGTSSLQGV